MWSPKVLISRTFITFWIAFFITEYERPAEISPTLYPSFCACLIFEFINTVHLEPKSTGAFDSIAACTKSWIDMFKLFANVSMNDPHPDEQASLSIMLSITSPFILMYFISCPPMSMILVTFGMNFLAAV